MLRNAGDRLQSCTSTNDWHRRRKGRDGGMLVIVTSREKNLKPEGRPSTCALTNGVGDLDQRGKTGSTH